MGLLASFDGFMDSLFCSIHDLGNFKTERTRIIEKLRNENIYRLNCLIRKSNDRFLFRLKF